MGIGTGTCCCGEVCEPGIIDRVELADHLEYNIQSIIAHISWDSFNEDLSEEQSIAVEKIMEDAPSGFRDYLLTFNFQFDDNGTPSLLYTRPNVASNDDPLGSSIFVDLILKIPDPVKGLRFYDITKFIIEVEEVPENIIFEWTIKDQLRLPGNVCADLIEFTSFVTPRIWRESDAENANFVITQSGFFNTVGDEFFDSGKCSDMNTTIDLDFKESFLIDSINLLDWIPVKVIDGWTLSATFCSEGGDFFSNLLITALEWTEPTGSTFDPFKQSFFNDIVDLNDLGLICIFPLDTNFMRGFEDNPLVFYVIVKTIELFNDFRIILQSLASPKLDSQNLVWPDFILWDSGPFNNYNNVEPEEEQLIDGTLPFEACDPTGFTNDEEEHFELTKKPLCTGAIDPKATLTET